MALPPRTPPRFVPTLTEVVQVPGMPSGEGALATLMPPAAGVLPSPVPSPPLLPAASAPSVVGRHATDLPGATEASINRPWPDGLEEYVVHRVMQRVDGVLDQRLREAITTVVQEQTRSLLPRLREEIESVVRHSVYEAVADELASGAPPATQG